MTPAVPHSERLIVVVGPSGAGKDSVLQAWRRGLAPGQAPVAVRREAMAEPVVASIYQLDGLVRRSVPLQLTADARLARDGGAA